MFEFKLRPEIARQLKDPDKFVKGQEKVYWGITIAMVGVIFIGILVFKDPENSMNASWMIFLGIGLAFWGEIQKMRAK